MTEEFKVFPIVADVTPKTEEKRSSERRADWHTPQDCFKLIDVQGMVDKIEGRLGDGSERMSRIEESIEDQRVRSDRIEHNIKGIRNNLTENTKMTQDLVDILKAAKGFFQVLGWIAVVVKWVAAIVIPLVGLWATLHGLDKK